MAIRQIAKIGEPVLRKKAKVVTKFDEKLVELLGHTPIQVIVGAIIGIIVGLIF